MRHYLNGDEKGIVETLSKVYNNSIEWKDLDYWTWLYKRNPFGFNPNLIAIAEDNGIIAGHYAVLPQEYVINRQKNLFAQSIDTVTHPDYRRRGIFFKLANCVYSNLNKNNIPFIFGFTEKNGASYNGFINELNWQLFDTLKYFIGILDPKYVSNAYIKNKLFGSMIIPIISQPKSRQSDNLYKIRIDNQLTENEIGVLYQYHLYNSNIFLSKSLKYYQWRLSRPYTRYYVCKIFDSSDKYMGHAIVIERMTFKNGIILKNLIVCEIQIISNELNLIDTLIDSIINFARSRNCHMIKFTKSLQKDINARLRHFRFYSVNSKVAIIFRVTDYTNFDSNNKNKWDVNLIDSDIV